MMPLRDPNSFAASFRAIIRSPYVLKAKYKIRQLLISKLKLCFFTQLNSSKTTFQPIFPITIPAIGISFWERHVSRLLGNFVAIYWTKNVVQAKHISFTWQKNSSTAETHHGNTVYSSNKFSLLAKAAHHQPFSQETH